ncbi:MAG: DUF63 family protein [Halobacteriota archaeon]
MIQSRKATYVWLAAFLTPFVVVAAGVVASPETFYDGFVWRYLFGPIVADAADEPVVIRHGVEATPGYTVVSTAVYAYYLLIAVVGVVKLLDYLDVATQPRFFFALVPYGVLGGASRVLEDVGAFDVPLAYFFISPVIYVTVFVFTALVLLVSMNLEERGLTESYAYPLAGVGALAGAAVAGYVLVLGVTDTGTFRLIVPVAAVLLSSLVAFAVWYSLELGFPGVTKPMGYMGLTLLWAHLWDASSTAIGVEHFDYGEKQPIVSTIIEITGTAYSFILVKAGIIVLIIWAFDDEFFEEYERLPYLLLVAVLAVGLGPGTRNILRTTIGV